MITHRHYLLHKPPGFLSQFRGEKKKKFLGELFDFPDGVMAIGRLDEESEGLLLLTTDGMMSEKIRGLNVEKEYYAEVDGVITDDAIDQLQRGVLIGIRNEKYLTKPCEVKRLDEDPGFPRLRKIRDSRHGPTSWISITLREGKFRQVRKMTAAAGYPTLRLIRVRIGEFSLEGLAAGQVKEIGSLAEQSTPERHKLFVSLQIDSGK